MALRTGFIFILASNIWSKNYYKVDIGFILFTWVIDFVYSRMIIWDGEYPRDHSFGVLISLISYLSIWTYVHSYLYLKKCNVYQQKIDNVLIFCKIWHLLQWCNQSAIILLTKINGLLLLRLIAKGNLSLPGHNYRRFVWQPLFNIFLKTSASRQL